MKNYLKSLSLEVRVGLLILAAVSLLSLFVFCLGGTTPNVVSPQMDNGKTWTCDYQLLDNQIITNCRFD